MTIKFLGHSSFYIKGMNTKIVIDPFDPKVVGIPFKKIEADIVLSSHNHECHNYLDGVKEGAHVIKTPGEYEVKESMILAFPTFHDKEKTVKNTVFRVDVDGVNVCHLGALGHKLTSKQSEELGEVDILLIPVGGHGVLDSREASEVINQISPSLIIPMQYQETESTVARFKELDPVDKFIETMGIAKKEESGAVKFSKNNFTEDTPLKKVLVLNRS